MPGLNKQGPSGEGPLTGRQQGMCKRTEDLPFTGGVGRGRRMGGRRRSPDQRGGRMAQSGRRFAQGEGPAVLAGPGSVENELAELKKQYKEVSAVLAETKGKIESLEPKVADK